MGPVHQEGEREREREREKRERDCALRTALYILVPPPRAGVVEY